MPISVGVMVGIVVGEGVKVGVIVSEGGISVQVGGRTTLVPVGWRVFVALGEKRIDEEQPAVKAPIMAARMKDVNLD